MAQRQSTYQATQNMKTSYLRQLLRMATTLGCCSLNLVALNAGPSNAAPPVPVFNPSEFNATSSVINNPHWPLEPGNVRVFEGKTKDGFERVVVTVAPETRIVLGVDCRVVIDRAYLDGELIEETYDWYAQDLTGNVWYFGEESHEIEDGKVVSNHGSWEAGVDGAKPGYIMLAMPKVGERYRQEYYSGEAEDMAEVTALDATVILSDGTKHAKALRTLEWTPLEPGALENKYYVAGIGLIRAEKANGSEPIDLVRHGVALKEAKLIIEHNATDRDTGFQGSIDSEGWQQLKVAGPEGEVILTFEGLGKLGDLGLTELFFETVEPENAEVPIAEMLEKLPEGGYTVAGPTMELGETGGDTIGAPTLSHGIPKGPKLLTPGPEATVEASQELVVTWEPVSQDIEGMPVTIIAYQLIIEKDEVPHPHMIGKRGLNTYLPATVTRVTVPESFLEANKDYVWEVLAIAESGNQTLSSGAFDTGDNQQPAVPTADDPLKLKAAMLNIEHNATDHDTGFQGFIDSEGWQRLVVTGPGGETVLRFEAHGELRELGMTELFFETVEPANADVPIAQMLAKLPAGNYSITGPSMQNGESGGPTSGTAWLTHTIPAGPELLTPAKGALVPADQLTMSWKPVTLTIDAKPLNLIAYQVIVQKDEPVHPKRIGKLGVSMYLPPTVTSVKIPKEIVAPGTAYNWEVLAIEESGNQTLSSSAFQTSPPFAAVLDAHSVLSWPSNSGRQYQIEKSENLAVPTWTVVGNVKATGPLATFDIKSIMAAQPKGFFRIKDATP